MHHEPMLCMKCAYAKQKGRDTCQCIKYGMIIGYSKTACTGYKKAPNEKDELRKGGSNEVLELPRR